MFPSDASCLLASIHLIMLGSMILIHSPTSLISIWLATHEASIQSTTQKSSPCLAWPLPTAWPLWASQNRGHSQHKPPKSSKSSLPNHKIHILWSGGWFFYPVTVGFLFFLEQCWPVLRPPPPRCLHCNRSRNHHKSSKKKGCSDYSKNKRDKNIQERQQEPQH